MIYQIPELNGHFLIKCNMLQSNPAMFIMYDLEISYQQLNKRIERCQEHDNNSRHELLNTFKTEVEDLCSSWCFKILCNKQSCEESSIEVLPNEMLYVITIKITPLADNTALIKDVDQASKTFISLDITNQTNLRRMWSNNTSFCLTK